MISWTIWSDERAAHPGDDHGVDRPGGDDAEKAEVAVPGAGLADDAQVLAHRDQVVTVLGGMPTNLLLLGVRRLARSGVGGLPHVAGDTHSDLLGRRLYQHGECAVRLR